MSSNRMAALALAALIIDLRNPNLGWIRTALRVCVQV